MKQRLKYLVPLLAIFVLLWGLLTLAEKMALIISITMLTGFVLFQFRQDRRRPAKARNAPGLKQIESKASRREALAEQARNALAQVLRQALRIPSGRFRQDVDAFSLDADHLVAMLDHASNLPRDLESLPDLLLEAENLLRDYAQLDTNPASQARKQEIQYALQHLHEQLKATSSWHKRGL